MPSRGAAAIGDQSPAMVFPDTVALSLREVQAANCHGNSRRENLMPSSSLTWTAIPGMAIRKLITPGLSGAPSGLMLGSIAAIKLKTAVVRGDIPVFQHVEEETRHGFLPAGAFKSVGRPIVRWSKTACQKFRLLSWECLLVAPLRPKSEGGNPRVTRRSPSSANFTAGPNADHCWYKKDREPRCTVCLEYSIERSC